MSERHKMTTLEKALPIKGQLKSLNESIYVVQCVLSVSPSYPEWSSVYWHAFSKEAQKFRKDPTDRRPSESPEFHLLENALKFMSFLNKEGQYRARVIMRHTTCTELLVEPKD
jgi:hypothetical protein